MLAEKKKGYGTVIADYGYSKIAMTMWRLTLMPVTPNSSRTRRSQQIRYLQSGIRPRRGAASAISASVCALLWCVPVHAKASYVTFDAGQVTGVNATDTVTGWYGGGESFVRTADGTITPFAVPGATGTDAVSINDGNSIAGFYYDGLQIAHGFIRAADGTITTFDVRGASETFPSSINNKGEIAGYYQDSTNHSHGFIRGAGGKIKTFDAPGATSTLSLDLNGKGMIVGYYGDANGFPHGFLRAPDGTIVTIDGPQAEGTFARAINIKGVITGWYDETNGTEHGFVRSPDGTIASFEEADRYITPESINRKGEITGLSQSRENPEHSLGFLRRADGTIKEFRVPDGGATMPIGINNSGVIAGSYEVGGFLRIP
jgi:hypothetical protein